MAEKKAQTIIIKKISGGHGGHHGGAWKVAYADFVTAMMAFFLVMWLMGSDEEIKAAVAHYFNNPTSSWRKDLVNPEQVPLGERTGAGEDVLNGLDGAVPEDLISQQIRPINQASTAEEKEGEAEDGAKEIDVEILKFALAEDLLFEPGSDHLKKGSEKYLDKLGKIIRSHKGYLAIEGTVAGSDSSGTRDPAAQDAGRSDTYEFRLNRVVGIQRYLIGQRFVDEEHATTKVNKTGGQAGKIEFILTNPTN